MKINKQLQKGHIKQIKQLAKKRGFSCVDNSLFKTENGNFIHTDFVIVDSKKVVFRIYIKKYSYDDIFWSLMQFDDDIKNKDSLRAIGAYRAPSVLIEKGEYELSEDVYNLSEIFVDKIIRAVDTFVDCYDVNEYVVMHENTTDDAILKCLAYIDAGTPNLAVELAKVKMADGDTGRFVSNGNGFFKLLITYLSNV